MASLPRHQTGRTGVFYIEGQNARKKGGEFANSPSSKPDKIYYIMYYIDGKKIEEKAGRESERMTPAKAEQLRLQRMSGVAKPNRERRRIRKEQDEEIKNRWTIARLWVHYKENNPGLKGIVTDENRFNNYLLEFAKRTPAELKTADVDALKLKLIKDNKKPQTIKNILELLRRVVNYGVKKGLCPYIDPSRLNFDMPKINNQKTEMLTAEERQRLLSVLAEHPNRKAAHLMHLAYLTGMRKSELFRLKWEHIDFENSFLRIVGEEQEGPKSGRDENIPLNREAIDLLHTIERTEGPYVFSGRNGQGHIKDISRQARAIRKAAGLPEDFRPLHGLRHTFASVAVSNGASLPVVQKLMTHKSFQLTQRYAHLGDDYLKSNADMVGQALMNHAGRK